MRAHERATSRRRQTDLGCGGFECAECVSVIVDSAQDCVNSWIWRRSLRQVDCGERAIGAPRFRQLAAEGLEYFCKVDPLQSGMIVAQSVKINERHEAARFQMVQTAGLNERRAACPVVRRRSVFSKEGEVEGLIQRQGDDGDSVPVRRKIEPRSEIDGARAAYRDACRRFVKAPRPVVGYLGPMINLFIHDAPMLLALTFALLMGLGAIAAPVRVTRQFDIFELTAAGRNEVRSVYGGFGLAMAAMFAVAFWRPDLRSGICLTAAAALAGMAGGRVLSALIDRQIGRYPLFYLCLEALLSGLLFYGA